MKHTALRCCFAWVLIFTARTFAATQEFSGATPLQWSIRMADAQMVRSFIVSGEYLNRF